MAEKGGRFNRLLNMIGLVETNEPTQSNGADYGDDYAPDNYGGMTDYAPRSNQPTQRSPYGRSPTRTTTRSGAYSPNRTDPYQGTRTGTRAPAGSRGTQGSRGTTTTKRRDPDPGRTNPYTSSAPRTPPYTERPQRSAPRSRTVMLSLQELSDCCDVIDNLIMNNTVVLTMDDMDQAVMQRAIDTLSGAVFALHATFRRASEHTFLIAPSGVEVNDQYDPDSRF